MTLALTSFAVTTCTNSCQIIMANRTQKERPGEVKNGKGMSGDRVNWKREGPALKFTVRPGIIFNEKERKLYKKRKGRSRRREGGKGGWYYELSECSCLT